ncbi:Uncharacterized protein Fot_57655 [Forsythia ovata]|uniref:Uncharacterized protein n=1 Tax=Forsythia ovata TaxID=205694 RepID=A0ABD1NUK8_9LAMI
MKTPSKFFLSFLNEPRVIWSGIIGQRDKDPIRRKRLKGHTGVVNRKFEAGDRLQGYSRHFPRRGSSRDLVYFSVQTTFGLREKSQRSLILGLTRFYVNILALYVGIRHIPNHENACIKT